MRFILKRLAQTGLICLVWALMIGNALALEQAGNVEAVEGDVWAQTEGSELRTLKSRGTFYSGDQIRTGKKSTVSLRFLDDTIFVLGAESEIDIDGFSQVEESFSARITKGTFRFLSGMIAKKRPQSMSVGALVATIGIRGTHVAGEVNPRQEENGEITEASAIITLLEPEEKGAKTAIEVFNEFGSVVVDEPGFGTEIPDEHSPPGPVRKMQIRSINNLMRAMRGSTRSLRTPKVKIR